MCHAPSPPIEKPRSITRRSSILKRFLTACDPLENVGLARPMPARAVDAPEQVELDLSLVGHRRIPRPERLLAENEFRFRGVVLPPVHPDVEPRRFCWVVAFRQRDGVRLHRSVDRRIVGMNLLLPRVPRRRAVTQLFGPLRCPGRAPPASGRWRSASRRVRETPAGSGPPWRTPRHRPIDRHRRASTAVP